MDFHQLSNKVQFFFFFLHVTTLLQRGRSPTVIYGCDLIQVLDEGGSISERTGDIGAGAGGVTGAGFFLRERERELVCHIYAESYLGLCSVALDASVKDRGEAGGSPFCGNVRQQQGVRTCQNKNPRMTAACIVFTASHWVNYTTRH